MKKNLYTLLLAVAWAAAATVTLAEMRIWTAKGGQAIEAEYVRDASGFVWLKPAGGKQKKVPIEALSPEDQNYIYSKTLPTIKIEIDDNLARSGDPKDTEKVIVSVQGEFRIEKTSKRPYPQKVTVYYYLVGWALKSEEYWVMQTHTKTLELSAENQNAYAFTGGGRKVSYDRNPPKGNQVEGMLVWVETADGTVLECRGRGLTKKQIDALKGAKVNERFDDRWKSKTRKGIY